MKFSFPEHQRTRLLWLLNATDQETTELNLINRLLQRYNGFTIPLRDISRGGIDVSASSLIKKLLKNGFLRISKTEFEIHPRYLNPYNELITDIKEVYTNFQKGQIPITTHLPCSSFSVVPEGTQTISLSDFSIHFRQAEIHKEELFEIGFPGNLPTVLLHSDFIQEFPFICWRKIRHYFAIFSGDNSDFFAEKIMSYRNLLIGKPRDLLESEINNLKRPTDKEYREECTRIILNRITASNDAARQVIQDTVSPENSYILTRFSYNESGDFDFLQALILLKQYYESREQRFAPGADDFLKGLKDNINICMNTGGLKRLIEEHFSSSPKEQIDEVFDKFLGKYAGGNPGDREVFGFSTPGQGDFLIHRENLPAFLDSNGSRVLRKVQGQIEDRWRSMIEQHRFEDAMLQDKAFRKLISELTASENPIFTAMVKRSELYTILRKLPVRSGLVSRLTSFTFTEADKVFELNRSRIYDELYKESYTGCSLFGSLIFRLLHWLARSVYTGQNTDAKDSPTVPRELKESTTSEQEILRQIGAGEKSESSTILQELWNRLPVDILPREEIDRNILTDLIAFYNQKNEVVFSTLDHIRERNLRRVIQKASHLEGYKSALDEYIQAKMTVLIASRQEMRSKTRF